MLGGRVPQMGDNDDAVVKLLGIIARNTGGLDGVELHEGDVTIQGDQQGDQSVYITSGENGVLVDETQWNDIELGINARVVNIRFTDDIDLAFRNPHERGSRIIPLVADESPFTIGDSRGINASEIWLRKASTAEEDPLVHFITYR